MILMTEFESKMLHKFDTLNKNIENLSKNIEALLIHYIFDVSDDRDDDQRNDSLAA